MQDISTTTATTIALEQIGFVQDHLEPTDCLTVNLWVFIRRLMNTCLTLCVICVTNIYNQCKTQQLILNQRIKFIPEFNNTGLLVCLKSDLSQPCLFLAWCECHGEIEAIC